MLAERLKELRLAQNLTQSTVAGLLNITREAYSMYETGKRQLSYDSLCLLSQFYSVSTDYLLGRSECKEPYMPMSEDETRLLQAFRQSDRRGQELILTAAKFESDYSQKNKSGAKK